jgi:hypothetical protein
VRFALANEITKAEHHVVAAARARTRDLVVSEKSEVEATFASESIARSIAPEFA